MSQLNRLFKCPQCSHGCAYCNYTGRVEHCFDDADREDLLRRPPKKWVDILCAIGGMILLILLILATGFIFASVLGGCALVDIIKNEPGW